MGKLILISGAARSGKSTFAEQQAALWDKPVAYLATAGALDEEMKERIKLHQKRRPANWQTFEETVCIEDVIEKNSGEYKVWLLECITLYISNLLCEQLGKAEGDNLVGTGFQEYVMMRIDRLIKAVKRYDITLYAVSNEVGWGLVPPEPLSRLYRDVVGRVNRRLAEEADEVYLVALGLPLRIKPAGNIHNLL